MRWHNSDIWKEDRALEGDTYDLLAWMQKNPQNLCQDNREPTHLMLQLQPAQNAELFDNNSQTSNF
jgi:hypothetical protein